MSVAQINLSNYEAYWLDYLEGNLSVEQTAALREFARTHPELEISFELDTLPVLEEAPIINRIDKTKLYKSFTATAHLGEANWQERYVAHLDGHETIEPEEIERFKRKNQHLQREITAFELARVQAEVAVFPNKQALKRKPAKIITLFNTKTISTVTAIAAALLMLFLLRGINETTELNTVEKSPLADVNTPKNTDVKGDTPDSIVDESTNETKSEAIANDTDFTNYKAAKRLKVKAIVPKKAISIELNATQGELALVDYEVEYIMHLPNPLEPQGELANVEVEKPEETPGLKSVLLEKSKAQFEKLTGTELALENSSNGFYFKMGNVEIERNR